MTPSVLDRILRPIRHRLSQIALRSVIRLVDDAGAFQLHQVDVLEGETFDDFEHFGLYGVYSRPHEGAEAVVLSLAGVRSHGVTVAVADRRYRLKGLETGEVALADDLGQVVKLGRDGIEITTANPVTISAASIALNADTMITGALTVSGDVTLQAGATIAGDAALGANLSIDGNLTVDGEADLGGTGSLPVKRSDNSNATKVKAK